MKALLLFAALVPVCLQDSQLEKIEKEIQGVVAKVKPSVAMVTARYRVDIDKTHYFTEEIKFSAVVYSKDGYLVTVLGGVVEADRLEVDVDGKSLEAKVVGTDEETGIAILKVDAKDLTPAKLAEQKSVKQGSYAIAVGNTYGLRGTSAIGFVSGLDRVIRVGRRHLEDMVQVSTPAGPGDSGGFVSNSRGELLGLLHSVYQTSGDEIMGSGILQLFRKDYRNLVPNASHNLTFAVSSFVVKFVADRIIKYGKMKRGWVGVIAAPIDAETRSEYDIPEKQGVVFRRVDRRGPAYKAGLRRRDILLTWNGEPVTDLNELRWTVAKLEEPTKVKVEYLRKGEKREAEITVAIKTK